MKRDPDPSQWTDYSHHVRVATRPSVRYILIGLGVIFTIAGILGIFLPLVPTTPLLLLAATCFARASTTFYNALLNHRWLGPPIRQWRESRSMTPRAKASAILLIVATFAISIATVVPATAGKILAGLVGLSLVVYLAKLPTRSTDFRKR
ncbi:MAG TPA: YbaN family protein [Terriglobia bacterium]|nr:YbaN family protein [Terriglobia bacterium]